MCSVRVPVICADHGCHMCTRNIVLLEVTSRHQQRTFNYKKIRGKTLTESRTVIELTAVETCLYSKRTSFKYTYMFFLVRIHQISVNLTSACREGQAGWKSSILLSATPTPGPVIGEVDKKVTSKSDLWNQRLD